MVSGFAFRVSRFGFRGFIVSGSEFMVSGLSQDGARLLFRVSGSDFFIDGLWFMVYGLWSMVYGLWSMVYGLWFMVYGLWFMVYGLWFMVYVLWLTVSLFILTHLSRPGSFPRNRRRICTQTQHANLTTVRAGN